MSLREYSDFYLERIGFEFNVNLRRNLKMGRNLVGRSDTLGVDIGVASNNCSRRHCLITVDDNVVTIINLNASNGTSVNQRSIKNETVTITEHDEIGIVGSSSVELEGRYDYFVYRLRKYNSENLLTFVVEDDEEPISLIDDDDEDNDCKRNIEVEIKEDNDDDDDDDVICLTDAIDMIDPKEEYDLAIHISQDFNTELKKELEELDELEEFDYDSDLPNQIKQEPLQSNQEDFCGFPPGPRLLLDDYTEKLRDVQSNLNEAESLHRIAASTSASEDCEEHANDRPNSERIEDLSMDNESNVAEDCSTADLCDSRSKSVEPGCKIFATISELQNRKRGPPIIDAEPLTKRGKMENF